MPYHPINSYHRSISEQERIDYARGKAGSSLSILASPTAEAKPNPDANRELRETALNSPSNKSPDETATEINPG